MPSRITETFPRRVQLEAVRADLAVRVAQSVKAGTKIRRAAVLGAVTATSYVRERTRTKAAGLGFVDNSAIGQVEDASIFIADDVLKLEDGMTIGTVLSVDLTTTPDTVTLTGNAQVNVAVGDAVMGSDGSQVAQAIADEAVATTEALDTVLSPYIGGCMKKDLIIGLDDSAITELGGAVKPNNIFKF